MALNCVWAISSSQLVISPYTQFSNSCCPFSIGPDENTLSPNTEKACSNVSFQQLYCLFDKVCAREISMLSLVLNYIFWFPQLITAQHHKERRLPYAVVMRSLQEMWLIEEMCSLRCEFVIYVNCKEEFAYGASMITDEAVHANKRIWELVAQLRTQLPLRSHHNNSYDWENAGLGYKEYDSHLKRDTSKNMAYSFYEIFLILYSESYLLTLEPQILGWNATVSNARTGTGARSEREPTQFLALGKKWVKSWDFPVMENIVTLQIALLQNENSLKLPVEWKFW